MAFAGRFDHENVMNPADPNREAETVYYLVDNQYGYLVEDLVEKVEQRLF